MKYEFGKKMGGMGDFVGNIIASTPFALALVPGYLLTHVIQELFLSRFTLLLMVASQISDCIKRCERWNER